MDDIDYFLYTEEALLEMARRCNGCGRGDDPHHLDRKLLAHALVHRSERFVEELLRAMVKRPHRQRWTAPIYGRWMGDMWKRLSLLGTSCREAMLRTGWSMDALSSAIEARESSCDVLCRWIHPPDTDDPEWRAQIAKELVNSNLHMASLEPFLERAGLVDLFSYFSPTKAFAHQEAARYYLEKYPSAKGSDVILECILHRHCNPEMVEWMQAHGVSRGALQRIVGDRIRLNSTTFLEVCRALFPSVEIPSGLREHIQDMFQQDAHSWDVYQHFRDMGIAMSPHKILVSACRENQRRIAEDALTHMGEDRALTWSYVDLVEALPSPCVVSCDTLLWALDYVRTVEPIPQVVCECQNTAFMIYHDARLYHALLGRRLIEPITAANFTRIFRYPFPTNQPIPDLVLQLDIRTRVHVERALLRNGKEVYWVHV
jgi:hypothetical protein